MLASEPNQQMRRADAGVAGSAAPVAVAPVDHEQRDTVLRWTRHVGLPMIVSLSLHGLMAGLLVVVAWTGPGLRDISAGEFEAGVSAAVNSDLGSSMDWASDSLLPPTDLRLPEDSSRADISELASLASLDASAADAGSPEISEDGGGFGIGDIGRSGVIGLGGGAGDGGGAGFGAGFGSGGGIGSAGVWDLRVAGTRFVYVVDFSGSILVVVDDLKRELKRSIGRLKPNQSFNVILFFSSAEGRERFVTESFAAGLQPAVAAQKEAFFEWIDRRAPMGSTEPRQALSRAIGLNPEVIFFFSDGYFDDKVVSDVAARNRGPRVRIQCLVFDELLLQDNSGMPRLTDGAHRLKRIADENGGKLKVVTGLDLRRR